MSTVELLTVIASFTGCTSGAVALALALWERASIKRDRAAEAPPKTRDRFPTVGDRMLSHLNAEHLADRRPASVAQDVSSVSAVLSPTEARDV